MVATLVNKTILDGAGASLTRRVLDTTGSGGPVVAVQALSKADGSVTVNPATEDKQDSAIAAVGGAPAARWCSGPITLTAVDQAIRGAGATGIRHVADWGILICDASWTANTVQIRDGSTVLLALPLPAGAGWYPLPAGMRLVGSAATALNIKATGAVTGTCTANLGGHSGSY